ncbi:MAG: AzlC family ABC transporter permease [Deltaproteobacteria bacterium]|nr:AzlC family ABC transporter permease [Deltaproteobacteria bacterium]
MPTPRSSSFSGIVRASPVVMGYLPLAFAYGVMAHGAHLSLVATLALSFFVYAGSAQFIAVILFAQGLVLLPVVLTTFIVNLRHLLMAASVAPFLARWSLSKRIFFATELTDETFALHSTEFPSGEPIPSHVFAVNLTSHLSWIFGSLLGYQAGGMITDIRPLGLDYALPAMFIGLLIVQLRTRRAVFIALIAGAASLLFRHLGFESRSTLIATVIGATLGMGLELWKKD